MTKLTYDIDPSEQAKGILSWMGALHQQEQEQDMVRRCFGVSLKAGTLDKEARSVRVVASTAALDSYDESVEQSWNLSRYEANPVVLYRHNQPAGIFGGLSSEETLPIGYASDVAIVDGALEATLHFVTAEANPLAEKVWQGFQQRSIRAVSVGFRPNTVREEKREGKDVYVLADNELYEISAVPIPANPEAVARSADANRAQLRRLAHPTQSAASGPEPIDTKEPAMDPKQLSEKIEALETQLRDEAEAHKEAMEQVDELTSERDSLKEELAVAQAEIDVLAEKAQRAETEAIEREIDALVGKKITPAERETMLELRTANPDIFAKLIEARADLELTHPVTPPEGSDKNAAAPGAGNLAKYSAEAKARAKAAAAQKLNG